jgi:hypothetical protein
MTNEIKVITDEILPEGNFPEDCKGGMYVCPNPECSSRSNCSFMSGFIKNLFMYQIGCTKCGFQALFTSIAPVTAVYNKYVNRMELENYAINEITRKRIATPESKIIRIKHEDAQKRIG